MFGLDTGFTILLLLCILIAIAFEFINGFHDTANAVATVIYTHSLKPMQAVVWSGLMNFVGVYVGGIAVAMGIVNLLPTSILVNQDIGQSISMIMSLILTAVIWNLGTWYFGIPCSSSHTLIGSIFGVGIAYTLLPGVDAVALNWHKVQEIGLSLLVSPILGFGLAMGLLLLLKKTLKNKQLFSPPNEKKAPPFWIRLILILTSTFVSFFHGSNDGQKGVGLIMIILIAIVPFHFAVDHHKNPKDLFISAQNIQQVFEQVNDSTLSAERKLSFHVAKVKIDSIVSITTNVESFEKIDKKKHFYLRKEILLISKDIKKLTESNIEEGAAIFKDKDAKVLNTEIKKLKTFTEYAPWWVILIVSLSLGLGTMIGWKRIVVTVGEKIGKSHLTYAQGASAELVASVTIGMSTAFGLPVSTTHVLSSGVAGTMVAKGGLGNLRKGTVRNIVIAWIITLPVTIFLSGGLFLLFRFLISLF